MKHKESNVLKACAWASVILGEPASKANSRRLVKNRGTGQILFIKSDKARQYERDFLAQVRRLESPLVGDLILHCEIYYRTNRPDLDESLIMDCLQKAGVLGNDRQIREKHIYHEIDKENPRAVIELEVRGA